ncbi:PREDICTED: uncharacterized protein LOC104709765 [Camelina sativa]|uniref:Uncharacterized protein LOC104709765 n=1 Tax=Camelina sativa TaxID=90675 RepID=A0ABM1QC61_CAMSA|nr:PREDICTED: uncharacterized protein LOC104709765 [Camelina sativa]
MVLNQCAYETTTQDSMDAFSSMVVITSFPRKRKAEFDPEEEEEEIDGEKEGGKAKTEEPKARIDYLKSPEWDVDSFDGLEPFDHYRGIKPMGLEWEALTDKDFRGFFEELVSFCLLKLNQDQDSNVEFVEVVRGYYRAGRRSKSYITFMAREKPDGPLVEYQAKCMVTLDRKRHPILCRPAPTPKP